MTSGVPTMKSIDYHLYQRRGYLYYRVILPKQFEQIVVSRDIRVSLGTREVSTARLYVAKLDIEFQTLISEMHQTLAKAITHQDITNIQEMVNESIEQIKARTGIQRNQVIPCNQELLSSYQKADIDKVTRVTGLVELYLKDCVTNSSKTIEHKRITYEMFQSICGDLPVSKITKVEARKFKETMVRSPANLTKKLNVNSYLEVDWNNLPNDMPQSLVTVNTRLISMVSLFTWAEQNDLYQGKNPFMGLSIKKADMKAKKRPPFNKDDIQLFFQSPIYTGSQGAEPKERMEQGNLIIKDYKYWIPLLGLYTGMRLNEICQLMKLDIQNHDGIWVINIDDTGDKKLKTSSSIRLIPIHHKLIEMGFIDYVSGRNTERLFPELPKCGKGSYSYRFSKEFAIILKHLGLKEKGLCFHSFRHSFIDGLRNVGVERAIAMTLVGHHSGNDTHSGYGYGYNLEILQREVNKLSF